MTFDFVAVSSVAASGVVAIATAVLAVRTWRRTRASELRMSITTSRGAEINITANGIRATDSAALAAEITTLLNQLEQQSSEKSAEKDVSPQEGNESA
ncbi:effector-associated constant component EACC1 [Streptomyces olivaceus]